LNARLIYPFNHFKRAEMRVFIAESLKPGAFCTTETGLSCQKSQTGEIAAISYELRIYG